ncbi:MAG: ABC transporter substrate-binding protein [Pseudomonadota bacterium]
MSLSRRHFLAGSSVCAALTATHAWALDEAVARGHVEKTIGDLRTLLQTPSGTNGRAPGLLRIMETRANVPLIARFSAGRAWREMSEDQKSRFTTAFGHYISVTYARRFDEYSGDPNISVERVIDAGRKGFLVQSPIRPENGQTISVDWLVSDRGGRVEVVDLVIEGISMATTQREEISAMIAKRGGDIERLISDLAATS